MRTLIFLLFLAALPCFAQSAAAPTDQLSPDQHRRAVEYNRRLDALYFAGVAWKMAVLCGLIGTRAGARIRDWTEARLPAIAARTAAVTVLLAAPRLANLPLAAYRHSVNVAYGISVESWAAWFTDLAKTLLIAAVVAVPLTLGALRLARRRTWWIPAWAVTVLVIVGATYLAPLAFDPLFFNFRPLGRSQPALVEGLRQVASHAGFEVPAERIFEMDASRKTTAVNAYMTGFGQSRRIVIWDTTLGVLTIPQIQTVFAHELGHYALGHIPRSIALAAAGLLALFWIASRMFPQPSDVALLPRIMLFVLIAGFLSEPVVNGYSRWQEHEADIYELDVMHRLIPNAGLNSAEVDRIMAAIDLDDPDPGAFVRFWLYDHPPTAERMAFAQQYRPAD